MSRTHHPFPRCPVFDREDPIGVKTAAALFPPLNGRPVHPRTVLNWMRGGVRGEVLESRLVGGRRATTREAVGRFLSKINPPAVAAAGV